jgi:transcriptional regulator GlxA family with amidase domain
MRPYWFSKQAGIHAFALTLAFALVLMAGSIKKTAAQQKNSTAANAGPAEGRQKIMVGFVLTEGATMIDFAGPWEVFQDAGGSQGPRLFKLFTIGESREPIRTSGGMKVVPDYTFDEAPTPQIVVVPAQRGAAKLAEWLRKADKNSTVVMSVCTGAFELANAGLLDGKQATTHHEFIELLQQRFPKTTWVKDRRYVQSDNVIYTAGGLSSGIDLALHIVEKYYGREVAKKTAEYMEYQGQGWLQ